MKQKKVISEIYRVLKPSGEAFITLNSREADSYKSTIHKRLDRYTIIKKEDYENEIPHVYIDYNDLQNILSDFDIIF